MDTFNLISEFHFFVDSLPLKGFIKDILKEGILNKDVFYIRFDVKNIVSLLIDMGYEEEAIALNEVAYLTLIELI